MSKLAVGLAVLTLGAATSVGGVYLNGGLSKDTILPNKFDVFNKSDGGGCVKSVFSGAGKLETTSDIVNSDEPIGTDGTADGCLVVNWDKQKGSSEKKGKGNFRFLWAMSKGTKGFILFSVADTKDQKLEGTGAVYSLEKKGGTGSVKKKKEIESGKQLDQSTSQDKFPKKDGSISLDTNDQVDYGGFMSSNSEMADIEGSIEDFNTSMSDFFRGYWIWENETNGSKTADQGSSKFEDWGKETYTENPWNLKNKLTNVKGKWINKSITPLTKSKKAD